jgi:hypothetical protein
MQWIDSDLLLTLRLIAQFPCLPRISLEQTPRFSNRHGNISDLPQSNLLREAMITHQGDFSGGHL